jgi:tetratricopeptide (TPR) repeat protein
VLDLLWDLALRIEDGALSLAERDLRAAQQELQEALEADASPERLAELMDRLQEALDKYLELLSESGEDSLLDPKQLETLESEGLLRNRDDFTQMLEQMREMAMTGAREAAQEMLQQLQEMLENLQVGGRAPQMTAEGQPLLKRLQEIMTEQDELLEETFDEAVSGGQGEQASPGRGEIGADRQESLRRALGEVMRQIGERGEAIPEGLGRAERLMRDAREELRRGRPDRAIDPQAQALQQLQEGASALMNRLTAGAQGERPGRGNRPRPFDQMRDPLGRLPPGKGGDPTGYVEIPKKSDVQRSREILDELYRRAGERHRPRDERDYIDRLLRWY